MAPSLRRTLACGLLVLSSSFAALANTAAKPAIRTERSNWIQRHEGFVDIAKRGGVDVLFVGDSITDGWRNEQKGAKAIWDREFAPLRAANFGIGGDRTQHVLWRLQHGELDGLKPKVVVLMIGTNNTGFEADQATRKNTPAETAAGVEAIVREIRTKLPATKLLLLAIFPRAEKPDHPLRLQVREINALLARLHDGKHVHFLDLGTHFLAADGTLPADVMPDFLHPNARGYQIWAAAVQAPLRQLLR